MKTYSTLIKAIDPLTGVIALFAGPTIQADSEAAATEYCQQNGLGYCLVSDECK